MHDLNDIHAFVQVVEQGSFTAASRLLGVAKSQLSFRVARLEEQLGVRLIQRTTRRSHVTEIGRRYYEQCRVMLAAAAKAQEVIDHAQAVPRGRIRVACPVMFAQLLLAPVLVGFLQGHPDVQVDLDICHHQVDVVAGGYDIAFRVRASVQDSSLVARSFGMDPQMLVASPAFLNEQGIPREPTDLRALPSVGVISAEGRHFWTLMDGAGRAQRIEHRPSLVTDDLQVLFQAAIGGLGVAQLPRFACRDAIARGQLVQVLDAWTLPPGNVHAVYPSRRGHTPAMRHFIDHVAEHLPGVLAGVQRGAPAGDLHRLLAVA